MPTSTANLWVANTNEDLGTSGSGVYRAVNGRFDLVLADCDESNVPVSMDVAVVASSPTIQGHVWRRERYPGSLAKVYDYGYTFQLTFPDSSTWWYPVTPGIGYNAYEIIQEVDLAYRVYMLSVVQTTASITGTGTPGEVARDERTVENTGQSVTFGMNELVDLTLLALPYDTSLCEALYFQARTHLFIQAYVERSARNLLGQGSEAEWLYPQWRQVYEGPAYAEYGPFEYTYESVALGAPCQGCPQEPPENPPYIPKITATTRDGVLVVAWTDSEAETTENVKVARNLCPKDPSQNEWEVTDYSRTWGSGNLVFLPDGTLIGDNLGWSTDLGETFDGGEATPLLQSLHARDRSQIGFGRSTLYNGLASYAYASRQQRRGAGATWEPLFTPPIAAQSFAGTPFGDRWGILLAYNGTWNSATPIDPTPPPPWEWTPPPTPIPGPAPLPPPPPSPTPVPQPSPTPGALPGYGPFPYGYGTSVSGIAWDVDIPAGVYTSGQWRISWTIAATYGPGGAAVTTRTGATNVASTSVRNTTGVFTDLVTVTALQLADINAAAGGTLSAEFDVTSINCAGQVTLIELLLT